MRRVFPLFELSLLAFATTAAIANAGCADVPEHELSAVLDYDGARFTGVLHFEDHDDDVSGGNGSCRACGTLRTRTPGRLVSGDLPIEEAWLEGDAEQRTYDVFLRRSPADQAVEDEEDVKTAAPRHRFTCRIYASELGVPTSCYGTNGRATMTLTRR